MSEASDIASPEEAPSSIEAPPNTLFGILARLGPGLIVAGSIVGSGELIATTATGAQAGFTLLWLIVIGCVIKVFCQVEMGRYAITEGKTTMEGLSEVPGPRIRGRGNWLVWYWFAMFLASIAQLGGIVGGVGQALAISAPLTTHGRMYNAYAAAETKLIVRVSEVLAGEKRLAADPSDDTAAQSELRQEILGLAGESAMRLAAIKQVELEESKNDKQKAVLEEQIGRLKQHQAVVESLAEQRAEYKKLAANSSPATADALARLENLLAMEAVLPNLHGIDDRLDKLPAASSEKPPTGRQTEIRQEIVALSQQSVDRLRDLKLKERDWLPDEAARGAMDSEIATLGKLADQLKKTATIDPDNNEAWRQAVNALTAAPKPGAPARTSAETLSLYDVSEIGNYLAAKRMVRPNNPIDDEIWATIVTALTALVLVFGRYGLIQSFSTAMVASFTLVTIVNLFMLQSIPTWAISFDDILTGISFRTGSSPVAIATALATFGIIGVGASELVTYPYWCLEKGYARFTGPRDATDAWAVRAKGWLRVMQWDAWCSMVVYTFATIAFYMLGASILNPAGLHPEGNEMIRNLSVMYEPAFGRTAQVIFLFGAFAVLYSTFFVANASHARVFADSLRVLGLASSTPESQVLRVRILSGLFPFLCLIIYVLVGEPTRLVLLSGLMQAFMLPMLAVAALYFRYVKSDPRIRPGPIWDIFLWVSAAGMSIAGFWAAWAKFGF
ncbi:Nramp family divalent metal transporter [Lignipirellula cremea]|uniref:Manganese transport protein MntH n=1 Tax=Lignipirellula cremea TaxID=2528010 RepID=A0A518DP46_9BACT|nr:Nramp family divalent metal transporter [Lignipirellula cremea]QDU93611.1 manganese transport protein MntH [Lignipirellula cremea]